MFHSKIYICNQITKVLYDRASTFTISISCVPRRAWRYQRGNQNPYIEEQTTQWPKEKVQKDKQRSTKHTYKTKDRVTRNPNLILNIIAYFMYTHIWVILQVQFYSKLTSVSWIRVTFPFQRIYTLCRFIYITSKHGNFLRVHSLSSHVVVKDLL